MTERPDALLFDLGRVLVGYDWTSALRRLAERVDAAEVDPLVEWMLGPDGPHDAYCLGQIDDTALLESIHGRWDRDHELDDRWLVDLWCDMFELWPAATDLIDRLSGQVKLGLVSNTNPLHFEHLDRTLDLRSRFDHLSVSHELGVMKPDPAIFEHACSGLGVSPERAWFVDDLDTNLQGARALQMRTHRFENIDGMATAIRALGFQI